MDALEPRVMRGLIKGAISSILDLDLWDKRVELEDQHKLRLQDVADNWEDEV